MKYVVKADKSNAKEVLEKETAFFHKILKAFGYEADFCFFEKGNLRLMISTDGSRKYQPKIYIIQMVMVHLNCSLKFRQRVMVL